MESFVANTFKGIFQMVSLLLFAGVMTNVLLDLQKHAFDSKRRGLVSMVSINNQLFGPARAEKSLNRGSKPSAIHSRRKP